MGKLQYNPMEGARYGGEREGRFSIEEIFAGVRGNDKEDRSFRGFLVKEDINAPA